ncbi:MAG: phosphoribosylformylglycinamidine synthase subunit PurS [Hyphomonadaceae bacterium]
MIVTVGLKPGVLDVQGKAVAGFERAGLWRRAECARRHIEIELDDSLDPAAAEAAVKEMCEKLLANSDRGKATASRSRDRHEPMNRYWFRPHRFGIGFTPKTWEGWAVVGVYVVALLGVAFITGAPIAAGAPKPYAFIILTLALTFALVLVTWLKTEGGWRWRWGEGP